jgi:hypothetical protein
LPNEGREFLSRKAARLAWSRTVVEATHTFRDVSALPFGDRLHGHAEVTRDRPASLHVAVEHNARTQGDRFRRVGPSHDVIQPLSIVVRQNLFYLLHGLLRPMSPRNGFAKITKL